MKQDRIYSMLGLAMKAGKVVSGEFAVDKSIKDGSAWLVIIASDASDNTTKKFSNSCEFYEVQQYIYGTKEELGRAIGRDMRSSLAITDEGFAKSLGKYLEPVPVHGYLQYVPKRFLLRIRDRPWNGVP